MHKNYTLYNCDARTAKIDKKIQMIVTSPPYFRQRNYDVGPEEIGIEKDIDEYIKNLVDTFNHYRENLNSDAVVWVNLGDKRNGSSGSGGDYNVGGIREGQKKVGATNVEGLKPRDIIGVPYRFAFAMQKSGWYWMSDCVWSKGPGLPEPVKDRPNYRHESFSMFTLSNKFKFSKERLKEFGRENTVWDYTPRGTKSDHVATYDSELVKPVIYAGTDAGDIVLDPFAGVCSTGVASIELNRDFIGVDLSKKSLEFGKRRLGEARTRAFEF